MTATTANRDLTTATPVEIDTVLYDLYLQQHKARYKVSTTAEAVHRAAKDKRVYGRRAHWKMTTAQAIDAATCIAENDDQSYYRRQATEALNGYTEARAALAAIHAEQATIGSEFTRRGGWTRAYLVTNGNGHVHSSMTCSTCNRGEQATSFEWMVDYSDQPETVIVADAGWRACTRCFPTAPIGDAESLPTKMFSAEDKTKAQAKTEREGKKAAALARKIEKGLTPDGSEFEVSYVEHNAPQWVRNPETGAQEHVYRDREASERFKTEQAAIQWVVQYMTWATYGDNPSRHDAKQPAFDAIIAAVAAKHGKTVDQVKAEIDAKVAAKIKRDNRA